MNLSNYRVSLSTPSFSVSSLNSDCKIDYTSYASWFSNPEVKKYIEYGKRKVPTIEDLKEYVHIMDQSPNDLLLGIFSLNRLHLGNIKFGPIDFENGVATVGVLIGNAEARGKGAFGQAFQAVSQHLAETFNVKQFILGVEKSNLSAVRAYEKAGFAVLSEGVSLDKSPYLNMIYRIMS